MEVNYYLTFDGNCAEAFDFYKEVFGSSFSMKMSYAESPMKDQVPAELRDKVMHVSLPVGNVALMGCDHNPVMQKRKFVMGNNTELSVSPRSKTEADRLFAALSKGGSVGMPMDNMFWGSYFGTVTDPFGIQWMIDCSTEKKKLGDSVSDLKRALEAVGRSVEDLEKISQDDQESPAKKHKKETPSNGGMESGGTATKQIESDRAVKVG